MKGLILRFARAVMTLIGKVNKAAETKSKELDQKVGLFEAKAKSAKTMREQMQDRKNEIKPQRS